MLRSGNTHGVWFLAHLSQQAPLLARKGDAFSSRSRIGRRMLCMFSLKSCLGLSILVSASFAADPVPVAQWSFDGDKPDIGKAEGGVDVSAGRAVAEAVQAHPRLEQGGAI
jgi:hypothetical protein